MGRLGNCRFDIFGGIEDPRQYISRTKSRRATKPVAKWRGEQPRQALRRRRQLRFHIIGERFEQGLIGSIAGEPIGRDEMLAFDDANDPAVYGRISDASAEGVDIIAGAQQSPNGWQKVDRSCLKVEVWRCQPRPRRCVVLTEPAIK